MGMSMWNTEKVLQSWTRSITRKNSMAPTSKSVTIPQPTYPTNFSPYPKTQKFYPIPTADRNIYSNLETQPSPTKRYHKSSDQTPLFSQKSPTHHHLSITQTDVHYPTDLTSYPKKIKSLKSEITTLTQELATKSKK
jgi:hypothetical protein